MHVTLKTLSPDTAKIYAITKLAAIFDSANKKTENNLSYDCNVNHGEIFFIPYCTRGVQGSYAGRENTFTPVWG